MKKRFFRFKLELFGITSFIHPADALYSGGLPLPTLLNIERTRGEREQILLNLPDVFGPVLAHVKIWYEI